MHLSPQTGIKSITMRRQRHEQKIKKNKGQRKFKGLGWFFGVNRVVPKTTYSTTWKLQQSPKAHGHKKTIQQPCKGQESPHIRPLASLPAFLASLVLNKRWFLAQAGSSRALIFFCTKPGQWCCTGLPLLAGPEGSSSLFFLYYLSHLIQFSFYFTCSLSKN